MSSAKSENKLPNSDPENPWRSGTLLGGLWECNRAILRWFESQLKSQPSVGEGRATPPSDEAEVLAKRRKRGRKAFEDDHGRLIQMAQAIDAGDVERNEPTAAVRLLPEYGDMLQHNREQFEKRLVDKFNKPEFQQELSQRRKTEEWQAAVAQRKKSKSSS